MGVSATVTSMPPSQVEQATAQKMAMDLNNGASQSVLAADYYTGLNAYQTSNPAGSTQDFASGTLSFLPKSVGNDQDLFSGLKQALSDIGHGDESDFFNQNINFVDGTNLVTG